MYVLSFSVLNKLFKTALLLTVLFVLGTSLVHATTTSPTNVEGDKGSAEPETIEVSARNQEPALSSDAYLSEDSWYSATEGVFTWNLPEDVTAVAFDISTSSDHEPMTVYKPPVSELTVSADQLQEGVQYVALQFKEGSDWGDIYYTRLLIDSVPPEPFLVETEMDPVTGFPKLHFNATDTGSGIDKYEVQVAGQTAVAVSSADKQDYLLSDLRDGAYTVLVKAYDKAGNSTLSAVTVAVAAGWQPEPTIFGSWCPDWLNDTIFVSIGLLLLLVLQLFYILYIRKKHHDQETLLRKEADEVQTQMRKIFSALRDEIYDQVNTINKKTRLTKKEKEVVDGLNKALEVSELLIKKEVDDVKRAIK